MSTQNQVSFTNDHWDTIKEIFETTPWNEMAEKLAPYDNLFGPTKKLVVYGMKYKSRQSLKSAHCVLKHCGIEELFPADGSPFKYHIEICDPPETLVLDINNLPNKYQVSFTNDHWDTIKEIVESTAWDEMAEKLAPYTHLFGPFKEWVDHSINIKSLHTLKCGIDSMKKLGIEELFPADGSPHKFRIEIRTTPEAIYIG